MAFNFEQWKQSIQKNLHGWKDRMEQAGTGSVYYFLAGVSLLPVIQAVHGGDWSGLSTLGATLGGAVSTGLLVNIVQKAKDKSEVEVAHILESDTKAVAELKTEIDSMLENLDALREAEKALSETDQAWFEERIQRELKNLHSGIRYEAHLTGSGAIAQGDHAKAVGAGGVLIEDDVNNSIIQQGNNNRAVQTGTYVEKQVIEAPDPAEQKRRKAFEKYLKRLSSLCLSLPLAALGGGDGDESDITLDKVYIALNTTERIENNKDERNVEAPDALHGLSEEDKFVTALETVAAHKRLALLGDPGAGKSTFVKNLLAWQAGVLLGKISSSPDGVDSGLLPVLIILRDLTPRLAQLNVEDLPALQREEKLAQVVWDQLRSDLGEECAEFGEGLHDILQSGECLLVLDGLDEVPQDLRMRVRLTVDALFKRYHLQRAILTCRTRSYTSETALENFESRTLAPFNEEQIRSFVQHWYDTQRNLGHFTEEQAKDRMNDLSNAALEADMRDLSSNPMLLTTMAIIHQREVGLPRERVRLYQLAVEVLLRRWQKHKVGDAALAEFLKNDLKLRSVMAALAYQAHRASSEKNGTGTLLRKDALDILEKAEQLGDIRLASDFLDYVDQRAGLLVGNGGELTKPTSYSFPHRTFQEYLAGVHLARQRDPVRTFYEHAGEGKLDLAARMAFEELYYNRDGENQLLDLAYNLDKPNAHGAQSERARLWAGQIIALVGRVATERDTHPNGGVNFINRLLPELVELLASEALPPLEREEAGRGLAKVGDPRPEVMSVEAMQFCHVPAGEFKMGEGKEQHTISLPEFWMSQYPVTNIQFDQFVKAGGYGEGSFWQEAQQENFWKDGKFKGRYDNAFRGGPINYGDPFNYNNHPVVGVSWYEALAFTRWLEEQIRKQGQLKVWGEKNPLLWKADLHICLPSEAEWEKAARGTNGREYPWGNEFSSTKANMEDSGIGTTSAVGCFASGASPYGLQDMSGNVWEWTRSLDGKYPYPVDGKERKKRENLKAGQNEIRILRGGSYYFAARFVRCACRSRDLPDLGDGSFGFRLVVSPLLS